MITNERQYKITKSQVERFRSALTTFSEIDLARQGIDPIIISAQRSSMEQQLADLESDMARYERLRSGRVQQLSLTNISELGLKLIEARIARGLSQRDLAVRLGLKEQQIQRYEQERYVTANLAKCAEIAEALGISVEAQLELRQPSLFDQLVGPASESSIQFDSAKLPAREMKKRGWLRDVPTLHEDKPASDSDLAAMFIRNATGGRQATALHKQHIRAGSKQDEYSILAWKARVLWKARQLDVGSRRHHALEIEAIRRLAEFSADRDGPEHAIRMLRECGVALVFEEHLPHTHLDGAAMLLDDKVPVIGMTLRYNRLDSFWFVLLHECAHVLLHADRGLREGFFDEEGSPAREAVEKEADEYARNALIPSELWKGSLVRFTSSSEQVLQFARTHRVGASVVAGRIRRERSDYTLFPDLVGQGEVKKLISAAGFWEN